jgi:hypothetical protein
MKIRIITEATSPVEATLTGDSPATVKAIMEALPLEARANTWGDEIYFSIPVDAELENPREVVEMGDLGYWPPGSAFCIFFGRTPASRGAEIRPASPVNVIGRVDSDPGIFRKVRGGDRVRIEEA